MAGELGKEALEILLLNMYLFVQFYTGTNLLSLVNQFVREATLLFGQMAPYLVLGFVFAGLLHAFVPRRAVVRQLGQESVLSAFKAALLGVPLPLCSCGVVPTGMGLRKRGASRAAVVAFLISTPQTGLDSIFATYGFFGWLFAVFRPVAAFVSGVLGGAATLLLGRNTTEEEAWLRYHVQKEDALAKQLAAQSFTERLGRGLRFAFVELLGDIARWLVLGVVLAAVISLAVPDDFFADRLAPGVGQMLLLMVFGVPLYVCSTASIPIAAVLMTKGISAGAAFVFLMVGPATNAATMLIIGRVMGWRVLVFYLGSIALLALGFGLGLEKLVALTGLSIHPVHAHEHPLPAVVTWGSALLLAFFMAYHFLHGMRLRLIASEHRMSANTMELVVEGMTCSHCVHAVTESLKAVPGVSSVHVTLETGRARVEGESLDFDRLSSAVRSAGYKVKGKIR